MVGTHTGEGFPPGVAATGHPFDIPGFDVWQIDDDGRAVSVHAYWNVGNDRPEKRFIVAQDGQVTGARLFLASRIGQLIRNGLAILGVEAVEEM